MQTFKSFLESSAGEVLVAFALMGAGTAMYLGKIPKAEDAIVAGLTLVSRAMIGGRNSAQ
ncbi:MAG TPA: hypothetical protein VN737_04255 [Bryobacteraceae bacterium]|nr:hypothetical protein [Bryobacteraceae bacterium]